MGFYDKAIAMMVDAEQNLDAAEKLCASLAMVGVGVGGWVGVGVGGCVGVGVGGCACKLNVSLLCGVVPSVSNLLFTDCMCRTNQERCAVPSSTLSSVQ